MTTDDEKSSATPLAILVIVGVGFIIDRNIDYNNSVLTACDEKSVNLDSPRIEQDLFVRLFDEGQHFQRSHNMNTIRKGVSIPTPRTRPV
ncbi:uncharacterized protein RAG0_13856 [Rhynchosporium agropyri]|uniref:Uncharacterized protein n=1 Tax=Rhynchosporium agropyri TaxID=914238 RepID=A0A1E1LEF3_9HELO|nr:uncharacterized protein RAG0_13856 [Rhynchosporium agropyri]